MKNIFLFCLSLLLCGCSLGHYEYIRDNSKADITKEEYSISLFDYVDSYQLIVYNKSKDDIEIDWNKTSFIRDGRIDGNFMFEGIKYIDRNNPKNPTIVMSETNQSIRIYPNNLVYFSSGRYGGWRNNDIPDGENGIYLVFTQGKKEFREKLLINRITQYVKD